MGIHKETKQFTVSPIVQSPEARASVAHNILRWCFNNMQRLHIGTMKQQLWLCSKNGALPGTECIVTCAQ